MNEKHRRLLWLAPAALLLVVAASGAWWLTREGCRLSLRAHQGAVRAVAISPDATRLASGGSDGEVRLWELPTGRALDGPGKRKAGVTALAFSPAGEAVAVGLADGTLAVWEVEERRERFSVKAHKDGVTAVLFSADGKSVYSAGGDRLVKIWDDRGGESARLSGHTGKVYALAVSGDGRVLASGGSGDDVIRAWRLPSRTPTLLRGHSKRVTALAFAKGTLISADRDGLMKMWEVDNARERETRPDLAGRVIAMSASEDGESLFTASEDSGLQRWSVASAGKPLTWTQRSPVHALAVSRDGKTAATGGADGRVRVWDVGRQR